mmetsp:Transcript_37925/g.80600  ORF Transcript_37925/g.80600 Transcript_37925/m.80600 type:complete len:201 (+) Transcript_37925:1774-2376(+)
MLRVAPQGFLIVGDGLLVVVSLDHRFPDLLHENRIALSLVQLHGLLERLDSICWLLNGQQRVSEDQVVLDIGLLVDDGLVAARIGLLVLAVLDVDVGHGGLGGGELWMIRLHRPQHVDGLVDLSLLDGELTVGHKHPHLLGGAGEFCNSVLHHLTRLIQPLQPSEEVDKEREECGTVYDAEHHHLVGGLLRIAAHCLHSR